MTQVSITRDVCDPLGLYLNQKDLKLGKKWLNYADLPVGGCVTLVSITRDVWDPLGLHVNQKYLKSGKKRLSYGQFTSGRLRDFSEYHAGCMGSIRASFEPKMSKIEQETAEFWPIYNWEVA